MTSIQSVVLEVPDPAAAEVFYATAFGLGPRVQVRAGEPLSTGFRGFTMSLGLGRPSTVDALLGSAVDAGATLLKPAKKSLWGYGGAVKAPDGAIWTLASPKKGDESASREIDAVVLQLGVADVTAAKQFYVDHGLEVSKSMGRRYVAFATTGIQLSLLPRNSLAKQAGVAADGYGSHRISVISEAGPFSDLDGFAWEAPLAGAQASRAVWGPDARATT